MTGGYQNQNNHRLNEETDSWRAKVSFLAKSRVAFHASLTLRSVSLKSEVSSYVYGGVSMWWLLSMARIFIIQAA